MVAERPEQCGERAVRLVAEAAAVPADDRVDEGPLVEDDVLRQVDRQALERHRPQVGELQLRQ